MEKEKQSEKDIFSLPDAKILPSNKNKIAGLNHVDFK